MITHIHHINFIVRDLDSAVAQYRDTLGLGDFIYDSLAKRAVKTARTKLGDTWLVLVQPISESGEPARFLRENGEGFFLLSLGTDDLDQQLKAYQDSNNTAADVVKRKGLENWSIADLPSDAFFGAQIQITQDSN